MSNVEFEGENSNKYAAYQASQAAGMSGSTRGLTGWLIKKEIVKSESAAKGVLLVILLIDVVLTFVILKYFVF